MRRFIASHKNSDDDTEHLPVELTEGQDRLQSSAAWRAASPPSVASSISTNVAAVAPPVAPPGAPPVGPRYGDDTTSNMSSQERGQSALPSSNATLSELLARQAAVVESSRRRLGLDALSCYGYPPPTTSLVSPLNGFLSPSLASNIYHPTAGMGNYPAAGMENYLISASQQQQQYQYQYQLNNINPGLLPSASLAHTAATMYQFPPTAGLPATTASTSPQIPNTSQAPLLQSRIGTLRGLSAQDSNPYLLNQLRARDMNNLLLHPQQQQSSLTASYDEILPRPQQQWSSLTAGHDELQPLASLRASASAASSQLDSSFHTTNRNRAIPSNHATDGVESFPMVLHRALADLELLEEGNEIASFLPDGKVFQIRNQFLFEKRVLPVFFPKMKSFASFQRQLNLYDFKRVGGTGMHRGAYHHDLFVREFPDQSSKMKRTKIKGGPPRGANRRDRSDSNNA